MGGFDFRECLDFGYLVGGDGVEEEVGDVFFEDEVVGVGCEDVFEYVDGVGDDGEDCEYGGDVEVDVGDVD